MNDDLSCHFAQDEKLKPLRDLPNHVPYAGLAFEDCGNNVHFLFQVHVLMCPKRTDDTGKVDYAVAYTHIQHGSVYIPTGNLTAHHSGMSRIFNSCHGIESPSHNVGTKAMNLCPRRDTRQVRGSDIDA
jgi:hypothetical protein